MGSELRLKRPSPAAKIRGGEGGWVFSACSSASSSELPGHLLDSAKIGSSYLQEQAGLGDGGFAKPVLLGAF